MPPRTKSAAQEKDRTAQDRKSTTIVRQLFEKVWNKNDLETAKQIIHTSYRSAENIEFSSMRGLNVLEKDMKFYRERYANLKFEVERMFVEGDTVVTTWHASGIANDETFVNRRGETQNKELRADGASLTRMADGKIIENRLYWPRYPFFP
jgi:ketosteroid isomerase-like protein